MLFSTRTLLTLLPKNCIPCGLVDRIVLDPKGTVIVKGIIPDSPKAIIINDIVAEGTPVIAAYIDAGCIAVHAIVIEVGTTPVGRITRVFAYKRLLKPHHYLRSKCH